jgi:hypothetical protein
MAITDQNSELLDLQYSSISNRVVVRMLGRRDSHQRNRDDRDQLRSAHIMHPSGGGS